jgi:hypothetical protein
MAWSVAVMKHFARFYVLMDEAHSMLVRRMKDKPMTNMQKLPPILEDLRSHAPEQLAELRLLLGAGIIGRPDLRRPGFFELDGDSSVYYIFRYPNGQKVLLLAAWERQSDPVAEMAACSCPAA